MNYLAIFLTFLTINCSNTEGAVNQDTERKALDDLAKEIRELADTAICSDNFTCEVIGFGSKPCGGNWEYLVYSNAIDVAAFTSKVNTYNALEKKFNAKYEIMSDCSVVNPPDEIICDNGKCTGVYN